MISIRERIANRPYFRTVINQSKQGHTPQLQTRFLFFFWRTVETHETQREFDDVLVNLGVRYFTYLEKNAKRLGLTRQLLRSRAGKFGKKVARKSVRG